MNINDALQMLKFLVNKEIGTRISPEEGNRALQRAQFEYFNDIYGQVTANQFQQSRPVLGFRTQDPNVNHDTSKYTLEALNPFVIYGEELSTSGNGNSVLPENFAHLIELRSFQSDLDNPIEVEVLRADDFTYRLNSRIYPVSVTAPIAKYTTVSNERALLIRPSGLFDQLNILDYYRKPVDPVWAFTTDDNGRPIYDSDNSVDFEFDDIHHTNIVMRAASYYSINVKDSLLAQYTDKEIKYGN